MTFHFEPNHVYTFTICFPFIGHIDIFDPEIVPSEVQQLLCVSLVGVLYRLVSAFVVPNADSNYHGLQTGPKKRDLLAGQWWLLVGDMLFCSFRKFENYCLLPVHTVMMHVLFFENII